MQHHIPGYVRREYQNIPNFLGTDITVDSPEDRWRIAVECKSRSGVTHTRYNMRELFKNEQYERISEYLKLSGRRGFLAIEARGRPKNKHYVIKWGEVANVYARGLKSFTLYDPSELPRPVKKDEVAARELKDGNVEEVFS